MNFEEQRELAEKLKELALQQQGQTQEQHPQTHPGESKGRGSGKILPIALALLAIAASPVMAQGRNWGEWQEKKSRAVQAEINGLKAHGLRGKSLCNALIRQGLHNVPVGMYEIPENTPRYFNTQLQRAFYCPVIPGKTALPPQN